MLIGFETQEQLSDYALSITCSQESARQLEILEGDDDRVGDLESMRGELRARLAVTAGLGSSYVERTLIGPGAEHARASATAALATLERLANEGWDSVLGEGPGRLDTGGFAVDAIAERTETFDPFLTSSTCRMFPSSTRSNAT